MQADPIGWEAERAKAEIVNHKTNVSSRGSAADLPPEHRSRKVIKSPWVYKTKRSVSAKGNLRLALRCAVITIRCSARPCGLLPGVLTAMAVSRGFRDVPLRLRRAYPRSPNRTNGYTPRLATA
jgi:hypothetical protein